MKNLTNLWRGCLLLCLWTCTQPRTDLQPDTSPAVSTELPEFVAFATTPPMGWNSFDAYDCRIDETQLLAQADFMAEHLREYGWEYIVLDYVWWHPEPGNWDTPRRKGHPNLRYVAPGQPLHPEYLTMDEYGRLLPSPVRFPSAAGGKGLRPIADYIHAKGLKFGLHIMRGIPRYAAHLDLPIKGTSHTAAEIAEPFDTCGWMNHMWGVDATQPGAQEYYDSLFELYAEWGVDYIKADDTMFPLYHAGEIEMIRRAIDRCGRPMVLSLSCGEAPLSRAEHLVRNANMWRISADFWDDWSSLEHNFDLFAAWSPLIGEGTWPDGDMLPIGRLSLDDRPHGPERSSNFTPAEQRTLITLWSIARSPLMMGGDLPQSDDLSLSLLTNPEVLAVNQASRDNRQLARGAGHCSWLARPLHGEGYYLALFNLSDEARPQSFSFSTIDAAQLRVRDCWRREDLGIFTERFEPEIPAHGAGLYFLQPI